MAFPNAPIDQQIATVNNIKYIYNSADNSWTKTGEVSDFQIEGNLNVTGNAIITAGVYAQGYFYANGAPFVSGGGTGVLNNWTLITANYTASTGDRILANTAAGAFTIFLPAAPTLGENIQITDAYNFGDNALIINPNGSTIEGLSDEIEVNIPALDLELVYGENTWQLITTIGPQGLQGNIGYTGSQGAGYTGSQGVAGTQGNVGYTGSSGTLTNWTTVTANYTAVSGDRIIANTSVGSFVITLPAGPALGDFIQITDGYNFAVNPITVNLNGSTLESQSNNVIIDIPAVDVELIYDGNTWQVINSAGPQGSTGYTGSAGTPGSVGYTGSAGANGTIGVDGYTGSQGAIGYTGSQGSVGFTGSKGDTGLGFRIAKSYLTLAALQADTSPTGIVAGEFAIIETGNVEDADNSKLYLWNGSSYTYVNDLSGAAGITGPQGYSGSAGSIGYTGSQGIIGYTGSIGTQGDVGYTGSSGAQGNIGYTGSRGQDGTIGVDGYTGSKGDIGYTGSAGTSGMQGSIGYTGSSGNIGYTGSQGSQGIIGYTGSQGSQGTIGYTGSASAGFTGSQGGLGYTGSLGAGYTGSRGDLGYTGSAGSGFTGSQGLPGAVASSQYIDAFTGNGVQTTFTLSVVPVDVYQTTVTIDGLTQLRSSYTLSNNSIIFSEAPANGDNIEVVSVLYGTTSFVTRTYTGDGNTTVYSVTNGVTADGIIVTDNGLVQRPTTDYTVSGASIIFAEAPADQTVIQIRELPAGSVGYTGSIGYTGSSGTLTNWSSVTANYTATSGDRIIANTAGGSFNISLPVTPALGDYVKITDGYNFSTNAITVLNGGSTIEGQAVDVSINSAAVDVEFVYDGSTWQVISTLGPRGYTGSAGTGSTVEILSPFLLMGG
jgi:hypothetical protein